MHSNKKYTCNVCEIYYKILYPKKGRFVCLVVVNATCNNILVISWWSVLLVEETGGPRENLLKVTDKLYHIMLYTSPWSRFELTTLVVIGTDCIGSCKSNYHTITATMAHITHKFCFHPKYICIIFVIYEYIYMYISLLSPYIMLLKC